MGLNFSCWVLIISSAVVLSNGLSVPLTVSARNATLVSLSIIISLSLIRFLQSLVHVSTTFVIFVSHVRSVLDFDTACTVGTYFAKSRLDYCNSMLIAVNVLARVVVAAARFSNPDYILRSLHWFTNPLKSSVIMWLHSAR